MNNISANRLANETSPYLLQHAHNPVDWYPWCDEALEKAKIENKVILMSIGYSACHWCHVMERESFENEDTAVLMNAHFVNIKIDREERPDLDHIYMDAVQTITGSGGWPLNVFLTPDAKPFFGGTYFPPVRAHNRNSWKEVLQLVSKAWSERPNDLIEQAEKLLNHLMHSGSFSYKKFEQIAIPSDKVFYEEHCHQMFTAIMKTADTHWGGFGNAPKFPQTGVIAFLFQYFFYTKDKIALSQALLSIDKMLDGGIFDHIGGGLARYSTDNEWLAPHFEKMLYDNALFIEVLCDAWQITRLEKYKIAIQKILQFLQEEMLHAEGGFYSALDADSEGDEGKYYVWSKTEIDFLLKEDAPFFCAYYDISEKGNWEHANILRVLHPLDAVAADFNMNLVAAEELLARCSSILKAKRGQRVKPALDDKIILSWNALLLSAISKAAIVLSDQELKTTSVRLATFIINKFSVTPNTSDLYHTWKLGMAKFPAFLDDYAFLANALLSMYALTMEERYLLKSKEITDLVIENFSDEEEVFFYYTGRYQQDIIIRKKEVYDGAVPSGNSTMAKVLRNLSIIFDKHDYRLRAEKMLLTLSAAIKQYPASFSIWASLYQQSFFGVYEIAVVGANANRTAAQIQEKFYLPGKIIQSEEGIVSNFPVLKNRTTDCISKIYICKNYECKNPVDSIEAFENLISHNY